MITISIIGFGMFNRQDKSSSNRISWTHILQAQILAQSHEGEQATETGQTEASDGERITPTEALGLRGAKSKAKGEKANYDQENAKDKCSVIS